MAAIVACRLELVFQLTQISPTLSAFRTHPGTYLIRLNFKKMKCYEACQACEKAFLAIFSIFCYFERRTSNLHIQMRRALSGS